MAQLLLTLQSALEPWTWPLQATALAVAILIAISSIDDLVVDAWYWVREAYRALVVRRRYRPLPQSALFERAEQPLAIIIPAWQEQDVIASMIETTVAAVSYADYRIYVGVYPNDPGTIAEVRRMERRHRRVVAVELPHPGPTSKADCLNHVVARLLADEAGAGAPFAGVLLHDPEDVIHPLELKFFNYLLPRIDLIQLPVVSLERRLRDLVAGAYMDEFAEWHAKDLVVRESLARAVPSAGVGTCLSRRAVAALTAGGRDAFNTRTLTEDYDLGARVAIAGLRSIIARFPVEFRVRRRRFFGLGRPKTTVLRMPLCVREYFPATFGASSRQKARWTIGIALQGWAQLGWSRDLRVSYFLMRDRKALVVPILVVMGYAVFLGFVTLWLALGPEALVYPPAWRRLAALVFGFNLFALAVRVAHRMYFVNRIYGFEHALVSVVRMVVGSLVSFAATMRALRIFAVHLVTRRPIGWDKTAHVFPTDEALLRGPRRLGEILVRWEALTERQLDWALDDQRITERPLGRILLSRGWLDEETLAEAISTQCELPRAVSTPEGVAAHRQLLPDRIWIGLAAAPLGRSQEGAPVIGIARPLTDDQRRLVIDATGVAPLERIIRESEVAAALRALRSTAPPARPVPLLGDILIERGHVARPAFEAALTRYDPNRHGRIGEFLVGEAVITRAGLADAIAAQRSLAAGVAP